LLRNVDDDRKTCGGWWWLVVAGGGAGLSVLFLGHGHDLDVVAHGLGVVDAQIIGHV
jgi:hypothetical protein